MNKDIIAEALEEEFEERVEQYSDCTKKHRFSLSYRIWERKALYDLKHNKTNERCMPKKIKAALCSFAAAAVLLTGGTVFASLNMGRFTLETKPDYSKLFIDNLSSDKTSIEEYYGLPEESGWVIFERNSDDTDSYLYYKKGEEAVSFAQHAIINGNMGNINTENAVVEPISLYEGNDGLIVKFKNNTCTLYWIYDGYLLSISGNYDQTETIKLAKMTKIINF